MRSGNYTESIEAARGEGHSAEGWGEGQNHRSLRSDTFTFIINLFHSSQGAGDTDRLQATGSTSMQEPINTTNRTQPAF